MLPWHGSRALTHENHLRGDKAARDQGKLLQREPWTIEPLAPLVAANWRLQGTCMTTIFRTSDEWTLTRLGETYQVNFAQTEAQFEGQYVDVDNPSTFTGEVVTGQGRSLIHFTQSTESNGYRAVHAGKLIRDGRIEGQWYDTAGNAGHFSLKFHRSLAEIIDKAKDRAIASHRPHDEAEPPPHIWNLTATEIEERLADIRRLIAEPDHPQAVRLLSELHYQAPHVSQVFSLLSQIFIENRIGYPAIAANHRALSLDPQDELAPVNSQRIKQFLLRDLSQTHPDRDYYYSVLTRQYPALFRALGYGGMMPLAGTALVRPSDYRNERSPYKALLPPDLSIQPLSMGAKPDLRWQNSPPAP